MNNEQLNVAMFSFCTIEITTIKYYMTFHLFSMLSRFQIWNTKCLPDLPPFPLLPPIPQLLTALENTTFHLVLLLSYMAMNMLSKLHTTHENEDGTKSGPGPASYCTWYYWFPKTTCVKSWALYPIQLSHLYRRAVLSVLKRSWCLDIKRECQQSCRRNC